MYHDDVSRLHGNDLSPKQPAAEDVPVNPLAGIPELTTYAATSEDDRAAGLKLVADSVAQQRHVASRILALHPACMALFSVILAIVTQWLYKGGSDWPRIATTWAVLTLAYLLVVRLLTRDYVSHAAQINRDWLGSDRILVTKFGEEVIGALVLGWVAGDGRGSRRKRVGRGLIRAWTVGVRYRGKGVLKGEISAPKMPLTKWSGKRAHLSRGARDNHVARAMKSSVLAVHAVERLCSDIRGFAESPRDPCDLLQLILRKHDKLENPSTVY